MFVGSDEAFVMPDHEYQFILVIPTEFQRQGEFYTDRIRLSPPVTESLFLNGRLTQKNGTPGNPILRETPNACATPSFAARTCLYSPASSKQGATPFGSASCS